MPRIIDQFGRKRCQKKRKDVDYKLLKGFFQRKFVVQERSAVKKSFSTYVCHAPDGLFWLNLYLLKPPYFVRICDLISNFVYLKRASMRPDVIVALFEVINWVWRMKSSLFSPCPTDTASPMASLASLEVPEIKKKALCLLGYHWRTDFNLSWKHDAPCTMARIDSLSVTKLFNRVLIPETLIFLELRESIYGQLKSVKNLLLLKLPYLLCFIHDSPSGGGSIWIT